MTALAPANKRAEGKPRPSSDVKITACPLPHSMNGGQGGLMELGFEEVANGEILPAWLFK